MKNSGKKSSVRKKVVAAIIAVLLLGLAAGGTLFVLNGRKGDAEDIAEMLRLPASWPSALKVSANVEPPFVDDPNRTNNAFNVQDFGEQGTNGWFYRYGNYKRPHRAAQISAFDGEKYFQSGANGLEIKKNFVHTAENISPILEWKVAEDGDIYVAVTYVKGVNGDANPSYPDGVQLMIYKGEEILKFENVNISTTEEILTEMRVDKLPVKEGESLYFVVDPKRNNAYDGGSLYISISDHAPAVPSFDVDSTRTDNNANSMEDFGKQGSNGWYYMYGTDPAECTLVSHELEGEYINCTSPNLSISSGFIHPAINDNAVLGWVPAVNGDVDLRIRYTKFEQNDGNPDFPDGVKVKVYKNDELLYEEHVDAPDEGENKIRYRIPKLPVLTTDRLSFMVDAEGNSSYDGGAFDITIIDINGATDESSVSVESIDTRQNFADVKDDFGKQGSNGWIFQWGYWDDPFHAYNMTPFDEKEDRYFHDSYLEIKRDYVNPGVHDRSAVIKWRVAQNGTVAVKASYTKMKNEDANPDWPDGTRVSIYLDETLLTQETFAPEVNEEVTKRLDVPSLRVAKGQYLTMVINGIDNNAYDGGKYEFAISSLSGLVGLTERDVAATYNGKRVNFASTKDDFGPQGYNGWYYQYGYYADPFFAVNIEHCENNEKYYTGDGVEIKKDYIMPANKGKCAIVKWIVAEDGRINIDLEYTKLLNQDANPDWPDGVTVYLMKNGTVLRKEYFAPRTDREITKYLGMDNVSVSKGDAITMIVDPGANAAYDGGKYMFVIEDAAKTPSITVGNHDNLTVLKDIDSIEQGTDGWWFLEGTSPDNAKVLTKKTEDGKGYNSRRTEGLEMKRDFVHTGATRDPIYLWVVGENGKIDVTGSYNKFGQEDSNPGYPDGITLKIRLGSKLLLEKKVKVLRGDGNDNVLDFSFDALSVKRGERLSFQICADGNWSWDAGRLDVVIEPTSTTKIVPGDDNETTLGDLNSIKQGTDGWWFLEGTAPSNAKLLTKMNADKTGYVSRKTEGLEMRKDFVHAGDKLDPIYQWVVAKNGKVDVYGSYVKFGQEDANPNFPDGVTVKIWHNGKSLLSKKVKVKRGDGNDTVLDFSFDALSVKRGDKLSFQICSDSNWAWDGGRLSVSVEPVTDTKVKPGDDNNTSLGGLDSMKQGTDGWWFFEGTAPDNAKLLTKMTDDKSGYVSKRAAGLEMKKDYVHTGDKLDPIYMWVVAKNGNIDIAGSYIKFGQNDQNPNYPDGVTLKIWHNGKTLLTKKVKVLKGDGNNNVVSFSFDKVAVKKGDKICFQICADKNNAWDAGQLNAAIEETSEIDRTPGDDNNSVLGNIPSMEQGTDGWWFVEGTDLDNVKLLTNMNDDKTAYVSARDTGLEMKKDYVHPGTTQHAIYQWVVKDDGKLDLTGNYVKFGHNDENPDYPDGITLIISKNDEQLFKQAIKALKGDGNDNRVDFEFKDIEVKAGDIFSFQIIPNSNNAYDAGRLSATFRGEGADDDEVEPDPDRTNNTVLKDSFGKQGNDGWYYGSCDWDSSNFTKLPFDSENNRYFDGGKPELKADFVEPGNGKNAAYKWVVAKDGTIVVKGEYVKFANNADPKADGTCVRIFLNGVEKKWMGSNVGGNFADERKETFEETYEVKAGDILIFAINPEGNDSYDGGRLSVEISEKEAEPAPGGDEVEPDPDRTNNTVLKDSFGKQGNDGWYYGSCDWDSNNFTKLPFDSENNRYYDGGKPELKADFVEPGNGKNAAYKWVVAKDGTIVVKGEYVKFANNADPNADGTCVRIFLNGAEKKWMGSNVMGNFADERKETFEETYDVKAGDILIFAINPEGNDSNDGGRLSVEISEKEAEPTPGGGGEVTPDPDRSNATNLKDSFSSNQGNDGWYYGMCEWNGTGFEQLPYDSENNRYYNSGKPELKADFVEPGNGKNAAYKWVVAKDGTIVVKGEYVKFANSEDPNADGTCVRIFLNGAEKKWMGSNVMGNFSNERKETFEETYDVKAGDILIFAVNPEGNDSYDGGRLSVEISEKAEQGNSEILSEMASKEEDPASEKNDPRKEGENDKKSDDAGKKAADIVKPGLKDDKKADEKKDEPVKKAEEEKKAEPEKKAEEEKKAEPEKKAEEEKKAEPEKNAEEEKTAEPEKKAEDSKAAEQEKKAEEAKPAGEEKKAEEKPPVEEEKPAEQEKPAEEAKPAEEEQKADPEKKPEQEKADGQDNKTEDAAGEEQKG